MDTRNYTYQQLKTILSYLGRSYRISKRRIAIISENNKVEENHRVYDDDNQYVRIIDNALKACSNNTQIIIKHDYLYEAEPYWYRKYYARSSYYRYKRKAVEEFLNHLEEINV